MAVEQGREYNPETAQDLRPRTFQFATPLFLLRYELLIPEYILVRLNSTVMDQLTEYMTDYACSQAAEGLRAGYALSDSGQRVIRSNVGQHLRQYLYERFSIAQENEGNQCWQVPETLQEVLR